MKAEVEKLTTDVWLCHWLPGGTGTRLEGLEERQRVTNCLFKPQR